MSTWSELLAFAQKGEEWIEGELSHVAVLTARKMHFDRLAEMAKAPADSNTSVSSGPTDLVE